MPHKMVYVCSHKSRVVPDKFGKNCENSMFFARDGGFSQVTKFTVAFLGLFDTIFELSVKKHTRYMCFWTFSEQKFSDHP